jgi:hypothetical protein
MTVISSVLKQKPAKVCSAGFVVWMWYVYALIIRGVNAVCICRVRMDQ